MDDTGTTSMTRRQHAAGLDAWKAWGDHRDNGQMTEMTETTGGEADSLETTRG